MKKTEGEKEIEIEPLKEFEPIAVREMYFNIGNSGFRIGVYDSTFAPTVKIHADAFGHKMGEMAMMTDKESLLKLSKLFAEAAEYDYQGEEYCHSASGRFTVPDEPRKEKMGMYVEPTEKKGKADKS